MNVESAIVGTVESTAASTAESTVSSVATSAVESVASGGIKAAIGAVILTPASILSALKIAAIVAGVLIVGYGVYRAAAFVEQAATDHPQLQVAIAQRDEAVKTANDIAANLATEITKEKALALDLQAARQSEAAATAKANAITKDFRHAAHANDTISPAGAAALRGLRSLFNQPASKPHA